MLVHIDLQMNILKFHIIRIGQPTSYYKDRSAKNESSVIIYSPLCYSKPVFLPKTDKLKQS